MSEWTPKVGDKVMVGEHGPYRVRFLHERETADLHEPIAYDSHFRAEVPLSWLTPAPEPEPDEPTAPGALVRDGQGVLRTLYIDRDVSRWFTTQGGLGVGADWPDIPRPITVVLADPAEVEQLRDQVAALQDSRDALRAERDAYRKAKQENDERFQLEAATQRRRADELQRRIDRALSEPLGARSALRGES